MPIVSIRAPLNSRGELASKKGLTFRLLCFNPRPAEFAGRTLALQFFPVVHEVSIRAPLNSRGELIEDLDSYFEFIVSIRAPLNSRGERANPSGSVLIHLFQSAPR